jgi:biopolymer transport protein ExbB
MPFVESSGLMDLAARAAGAFLSGGPVMLPIGAVALVMWTLAIHKLRWFLVQKRCEASPERCLDLLRPRGGEGGATCPEGGRPASRWQADILARYLRCKGPDPALNREVLAALRAPHAALARRHVATILVLAAVAPLLGLLGTVSGMISTFDAISQFGTGNARALASGISEALVTTQTGLVVAVPGLLLGGLLHRRALRLEARMELFCLRVQRATENVFMEITATEGGGVAFPAEAPLGARQNVHHDAPHAVMAEAAS